VRDLPYNKLLKETARGLRKAGNLAESLLWRELRNKQFLGLDFYRQKILGHYIADFYCDKKRIVIEIDGSSHIGREKEDENRDYYFSTLGIRTIRITDKDVKTNMEGVIHYLKGCFAE